MFAVILILMLGFVLVIPYFYDGHHCGSNMFSCTANLKQLSVAMELYASLNDDVFPEVDCADAFQRMIKDVNMNDMKILICYKDQIRKKAVSPTEFNENTSSYIYIGGTDKTFSTDMPLIFDKPDIKHENIYIFAFADGHIERIQMNNVKTVSDMVKQFLSMHPLPQKESDHLTLRAAEIDKKLNYTD